MLYWCLVISNHSRNIYPSYLITTHGYSMNKQQVQRNIWHAKHVSFPSDSTQTNIKLKIYKVIYIYIYHCLTGCTHDSNPCSCRSIMFNHDVCYSHCCWLETHIEFVWVLESTLYVLHSVHPPMLRLPQTDFRRNTSSIKGCIQVYSSHEVNP